MTPAHGLTLAGRGVRLEPLALDHAPALAAAAAEDRSTYAFTPVPDGPGEARDYVEAALAETAAGNHLPFAVVWLGGPERGPDRVVGTTRFVDVAPWQWPAGRPEQRHGVPDAVEIGHTWLAASAQRSAVNTEAKLLLLEQAFGIWQVYRVRLKTDVRNRRSRAAIERLGARLEGVLRADRPATDGGPRDSAYYAIVAHEWPEIRERLQERLREGPGQ